MGRVTASYRVDGGRGVRLARPCGCFLSARIGFDFARSHCQADGEGGGLGAGVVSDFLSGGGGRAHRDNGGMKRWRFNGSRGWI